jgi:hypothetical protein
VFIAAVVFILPSNLKAVASLLYAFVMFVALCFQRPNKFGKVILSPAFLISLVIFFVAILFDISSPYPKSFLIVYSSFLILSVLLFYGRMELPRTNLAIERFFYVVVSAIVVYQVVTHLGATSAMYMSGAYDKNYLGIIIYLYFLWCWATHRRLGLAISIFSAAVIGSRNLVLMLILFFILLFFQSKRKKQEKQNRKTNEFKPFSIFLIFFAMFLIIAAFSYWWSESMVGSSTSAYQASINDSSNAIRFNSDQYAIQYISEHPQLILFGYDNDIISAMNIIQPSSLNGTETALTGTFFNGYRIVQPHHVILNMLLKEGIIYTVAYYLVLSFLLSKYFRKDNFAYWVPYLFGCMFMHSLLVGYYLVFLLVVLTRCDTGKSFSFSRAHQEKKGKVKSPNNNHLIIDRGIHAAQ